MLRDPIIQNLFPETYRNLISCQHQRDNRTHLEYAQDLVASWLVEDYFLEILNSNGLRAALDGADRNRRILANVRTSASSDFTVSYNGNSRKLELMNDYTGYWSSYMFPGRQSQRVCYHPIWNKTTRIRHL